MVWCELELNGVETTNSTIRRFQTETKSTLDGLVPVTRFEKLNSLVLKTVVQKLKLILVRTVGFINLNSFLFFLKYFFIFLFF